MNRTLKANDKSLVVDFGSEIYVIKQSKIEKKISNTANLKFDLKENTHLDYIFAWSNQTQDRNLHINLSGEYAQANICGYIIATHQDQNALSTIIEHSAIQTMGSCFIKSVLDDSSNLSIHGMIKINSNASNSQDQLTEKILVLSQHAVGELKPELEILNHDVKASHATTISHIDNEQIWHMLSRGLSPKDAKKLLVNGFITEITQILSKFSMPKNIYSQIIKQSKVI